MTLSTSNQTEPPRKAGRLARLRALGRYSLTDLARMAGIFCATGHMRCLVRFTKFRTYAHRLGTPDRPDTPRPPVPQDDQARAKHLGRLVASVSRRTPWDSLCLVQALVASRLLRKAGIPATVYLGVARAKQQGKDDPLKAHAWVIAGDTVVTGGPHHGAYTAVGAYHISP